MLEPIRALSEFVPGFLRVLQSDLTLEQLHVLITQGLTPEQAKETLKCIKLERSAHSRDGNHSQP